jgi:hypothetical protein
MSLINLLAKQALVDTAPWFDWPNLEGTLMADWNWRFCTCGYSTECCLGLQIKAELSLK